MASPLQYPNINGFDFSWASVEIACGPLTNIVQTKSLKYKDNRTIGKIFGTSPRKIGRTRGQIDPNGSWEVYRAAWDQLMSFALTAGGLVGFGEMPIDIIVKYAEPSNPAYIVTDILKGCMVHSPEGGGSEGTDGLTVPFELDVMEIGWGRNPLTGLSHTQLSTGNPAISIVTPIVSF